MRRLGLAEGVARGIFQGRTIAELCEDPTGADARGPEACVPRGTARVTLLINLLRDEQRASGATVVMVSSDLDRLLTVTDRVPLDQGRLHLPNVFLQERDVPGVEVGVANERGKGDRVLLLVIALDLRVV